MPESPPSSNGSPRLSEMPSVPPDATAALPAVQWRTNLWLFVATVASVFATYFVFDGGPTRERVADAAAFTVTLLGILLFHEFGHYIAARYHRVDASLPFFIPLPILSPFGTMGA